MKKSKKRHTHTQRKQQTVACVKQWLIFHNSVLFKKHRKANKYFPKHQVISLGKEVIRNVLTSSLLAYY